MIATNTFVYSECLKEVNEKTLIPGALAKFKTYCDIIIKNNPLATFKELCDSCKVILLLMLESPDTDLPVMKFFIS